MLVEHLLVGELLKHAWLRDMDGLDIARPEVDDSGYDLIIEWNRVIRHVQLKTSKRTAKTSRQTANLALADKPSGCIIWTLFDEDSMELGPFRFFGGSPGAPMDGLSDLRVAQRTTPDARGRKPERNNHRVIPRKLFREYSTVPELLRALFG